MASVDCFWESSSLEENSSYCYRCFLPVEEVPYRQCQDCGDYYCRECGLYHKMFPTSKMHAIDTTGYTNIRETEEEEDIQKLIENLDLQTVEAVKSVSMYLLKDTTDVTGIEDLISQIISALMKCLENCDDYRLQFEVIEAFHIMSTRDVVNELLNALINMGAIKQLVPFISSPHQQISKSTIEIMADIADQSHPEYRNYVIEYGAIQPILHHVQPSTALPILRSVSEFICKFFRDTDSPPKKQILQEMLSSVKRLLTHTDEKILTESLMALHYLTLSEYKSKQTPIQPMIDAGITPLSIRLLQHQNTKIQKAALMMIGNIVAGSDEQTQVVINDGLLSDYKSLLIHQCDKIRKEAYMLLSNIAAGNDSQRQRLIDTGLIQEVLVQILQVQGMAQTEAAWVIGNMAVYGNKQQVEYIKDQHCVPVFCALLDSENSIMLGVVLQALQKLLELDNNNTVCTMIEERDAITRIKLLQEHRNRWICDIALKITEKYFKDT